MLTELLPKSFKFAFGEAEIELRHTLRSFLALEERGLDYMDIFKEKVSGTTIFEFFRAGLVMPIEAEMMLDAKMLLDIVEIVGYETVWDYCKQAVLQAMPKKEENVVQKPPSPDDEEFSFVKLRTLICDVMGKSDDFFWSSTLGELTERWTLYARAMGYAEEPERIKEFDDEGM